MKYIQKFLAHRQLTGAAKYVIVFSIESCPVAAADLRQAERGETPHESVTVMLPWEDEPDTPRLDCNLPEPDCVCFSGLAYFGRGCVRPVLRCGAFFCVPPSLVFPPARWGAPGNNILLSLLSPNSKIGSTSKAAQVSRPPGRLLGNCL